MDEKEIFGKFDGVFVRRVVIKFVDGGELIKKKLWKECFVEKCCFCGKVVWCVESDDDDDGEVNKLDMVDDCFVGLYESYYFSFDFTDLRYKDV